MPTARPALFHEPTKVRVQLGCAARDVHGGDVRLVENTQAVLEGLSAHGLAPVRARVHMAVPARLIAQLAHVDLECVDLGRPQRPQTDVRQGVLKLRG